MALITCPECGREIDSDSLFCSSCGCKISVLNLYNESLETIQTQIPVDNSVDNSKINNNINKNKETLSRSLKISSVVRGVILIIIGVIFFILGLYYFGDTYGGDFYTNINELISIIVEILSIMLISRGISFILKY